MAWIAFILLILGAASVFIIPGVLITMSIGLRGMSSLLFAPAVGVAAVGLWTLVWSLSPWAWGLAAWAVLVAALTLWYLLAKAKTRPHVGMGFTGPKLIYLALGLLAYIAIQGTTLVAGVGSPDAIPHLGDAGFHLQGALVVAESGDVFPTSALAELYVPGGAASVFYPTLWHGWVSIIMTSVGATQATNAAVFALSLILWPISIVALASSLKRNSDSIGFFALICAAPIAVFPGALAVAYSVYPYALATSVFPGALGALIMLLNRSPQTRGARVAWGIVFVLAVAGAFIAQPTGAIFPVYAAIVSVVLIALVWVRDQMVQRRVWQVLAAVFGMLTALALVLVWMRKSAYLSQLASYPRPQVLDRPILGFLDGTVAAVSEAWLPWVLILLAAVVGGVMTARSVAGWTYVITTITAVIAFVAAAGPHSPLRALTGPWYKDHLRLAAVATVLVAVLAAVCLSWLWESFVSSRLGERSEVAVLTGGTLAIVAAWLLANPAIARVEVLHIRNGYALDNQEHTTLTEDTAAVLSRLDEHFEAGERVLVAYRNGAGFVTLFSEMEPMLPLDTLYTEDQKELVAGLGDIGEDPRVCSLIQQYDISAFMADTGRSDRDSLGLLAGPPYLDVSEDYELVDQQGTVKVWRITGCE